MRKLNIKDNKGFTIIEVLIVLAIAGLILIVVLLAVPALQRNGRNTTMKNDASSVAGGVNEYISNNNGKQPNSITGTETITILGPGGTTTTIKVQGGTTASTTLSTATKPTTPAPGTVNVWLGHRCDDTPNTRANAVWYSTENSSNAAQAQCIDT